jgi:hypothetical protein
LFECLALVEIAARKGRQSEEGLEAAVYPALIG